MIITICTSCKKRISTPVNSLLTDKFDEYFTALTELRDFNGVIYIRQGNEEILHEAYNIGVESQSSLKVSIDHQFDIHSISKLMAKYLVADLVEKGIVNLEDKLNDFIPDFPQGDKITIGMLLHHQSGLPREFVDFGGDLIDLTPTQIVEITKQQQLLFEPGTDEQYSNLAYQLIYFIIGELSEGSFEQALVNKLFEPVGMNHSGAHFFTNGNKPEKLAFNHEERDEGIVTVDNVLNDEFKVARIYATSNDLMKFMQHIGTGMHKGQLANEEGIIKQSGGADGIRAHVYFDVKTENTFVLLSNYDAIPFKKTLSDIEKLLKGQPCEIPKEINRVSIEMENESLEQYLGTYIFADMNNSEFKVMLENDLLVVFQDGENIGELSAESEHVFFFDPKERESMTFVKNGNGQFDLMMGWRGIELKGILK